MNGNIRSNFSNYQPTYRRAISYLAADANKPGLEELVASLFSEPPSRRAFSHVGGPTCTVRQVRNDVLSVRAHHLGVTGKPHLSYRKSVPYQKAVCMIDINDAGQVFLIGELYLKNDEQVRGDAGLAQAALKNSETPVEPSQQS